VPVVLSVAGVWLSLSRCGPKHSLWDFIAHHDGRHPLVAPGSFFSDDALFIDGPRVVHRGVDAIRSELESELAMGFGNVKIDVHSLISDGGNVMMEGTENYRIGGKPFSLEVMRSFHVDADGRITRWRYSYDPKSVTDQIEAAGFKVPETA
jgi:limonene-1,2-epoxide hydrolase